MGGAIDQALALSGHILWEAHSFNSRLVKFVRVRLDLTMKLLPTSFDTGYDK